MNRIGRQKGATAISWILIVALIGFLALMVLKIAPVYMNSFTVKSVLSDMEKEPSLGSKSLAEIISTLNKRLSVNMIDTIKRDDIYIENKKNTIILEIDYEVRRNLIGNIDFIVHFEEYAEIPRQ